MRTEYRPDLLAIFMDSPSNAPGGSPVLTPSPPSQSQAPQSPNIPESQLSDPQYSTQSSESESEYQPRPEVSWAEIETIVEFKKRGVGTFDGTKQGVAYTTHLLAQRPNRVAVCGLYVSQRHFSLVFVDASKAYYTTLSWSDESARRLLFRILYYIHYPPDSMVDPTITRQGDTYTIKIENKDYKGYTLKSCGHPIGRRTVVFQCEGADLPVIKEQYVRCSRGDEILEKGILERVHDPEEVPGVVRMFSCGWVKRGTGCIECGMDGRKRRKVRFLLRDEGHPFMEIRTPYDALVAAWDALEGK